MAMIRCILFTLALSFCLISHSQNWVTDFTQAKNQASAENKKIILVFQGSDWCGPCIKLNKEVWSTEEFQKYAAEKFVMLQADFPKRKANALSEEQQAHNNKLAEQYNKSGYFPFVVVMDQTGKTLGSTGYKPLSPTEYIALLESF